MSDLGGKATGASIDETDTGAEFLQRRLRRLFGVMSIITWPALASHIIIGRIAPASHPVMTMSSFVAGATLPTFLFWLLRPQRRRSIRELVAIDTAVAVFICSALAALMVVGFGRIDEVYVCIVLVGFVILGHTLVVPMTWQRTFWLSLACAVPSYAALITIVTAFPERLSLPAAAFLSNGAFMVGIPVALGTVSAGILTGLRQQVRDARRLGQYTLGEKIAEGGLGTIYRAHHALLRRPTAIKLLRPNPANHTDDEAIRRFEREVQITAELTDPHIVAIYDYGRSRDGTFYYAMEYLDGIDLERLVREFGAQPCGRVVSIIRQVCDALAEAHCGGLIHRDIKPANILLCERGLQTDVVKVVDFGLVQRLDVDGVVTEIAGTPGYLSPESIADPSKVNSASDLYALGAVAYFLLTGSTVFDGDTFAELCDTTLHKKPIPPSARTANPIPAELDALILACLEKDPAARPASAVELRDALEALEIPPWNTAKADRWWSAFRARPAWRPGSAPIDPVPNTVVVGARRN